MSNVHLELIEDSNGDLIDINYFHHGCLSNDLPSDVYQDWPAPEALDYPVYCHECGELIEEIGLTDYGKQYLVEMLS